MKIGIIREGKTPPDARVALTPAQCVELQQKYGLEIVVEPSPIRCYADSEYLAAGIKVTPDLADCQLLLGIKEVPVAQLHTHKTYCFFSHTIKKQPCNRKLLQAILQKEIRLIDWETLTDTQGNRLIAFGRWAGIVGAHNGLMTWAMRTNDFDLPQMKLFSDFAEATAFYKKIKLPAIKIVLTGTGRVANGAAEVLNAMGIKQVSPDLFLYETFDEAVYTQLGSRDYAARTDGGAYSRDDYHAHPETYHSTFLPFTKAADIFINGIFWNTRFPVFYTAQDMQHPDFRIQVVADITCDIMPNSSVPSTLDASTIADPIYGYNVATATMCAPHGTGVIDVMAIDNLPNELPRDASQAFGEQFMKNVLPELLQPNHSTMIDRATIAKNGVLMPNFTYLNDYVAQDIKDTVTV
jgi:saccharopine dehydrogenase (NAD+, L-lysine forming)